MTYDPHETFAEFIRQENQKVKEHYRKFGLKTIGNESIVCSAQELADFVLDVALFAW